MTTAGRWEQYVEQAAEAGWEALRPRDWMGEDGIVPMPCWADAPEHIKAESRLSVAASLSAVGSLIAEDTLDRLVAAAHKALERDGAAAGNSNRPYQTDVDALRNLLDRMDYFSSNDQRARYLLSSNWLRDRGAAAAVRIREVTT